MRLAFGMGILLLGSCALADTNEVRRLPSSANATAFTITGELQAFGVLGQSQISVPWQKRFTLEQVIKDLGGFTDFATHILVVDADGSKKRFSISREFRTDDSVRKMKIKPGMIIRVERTVD